MKKVLLFLLISLVPCIGYAESGNISISGKTYTYSTAKTKFVDPFIKKITVQKTTQAKERFKKLYIKQLETKKKLAEKKNDTNLSVFYTDMILQISQVSTQGVDYAVQLKYNTEADFQKAITNLNALWTCDFPGEEYKKHKSIFTGITCTMDDVLKERVGIVTALFNGQGTSQETRNNTTTAVIAKYGKDSVEYNYYMAHIDAFAPVQTINNNVNNGGIGGSVNDSSVIVSSLSQAENKKVLVQRNIVTAYNGNGGANQSKSSFISWVVSDFGGPNTYAVEYANTLKFNDTVSTSGTTSSSKRSVVNNSQQSGEAGFYNGTSGMTQEQIAHRMIENDILTLYTQGSNGANQSKAGFIAFVTEQYGPNTYAVQYANTFTFNQP